MFKQCSYFMLHDWAGLNYVTFLGTQYSTLNFLFICCDQILTLFVCCVLKWLLLCGCWLIFVKQPPPENIAIYRLSSFLKHWLLFSRQPQSQRANCNLTWADNKIVLDATDTLKVLVISLDALTQEYTSIGWMA